MAHDVTEQVKESVKEYKDTIQTFSDKVISTLDSKIKNPNTLKAKIIMKILE